jgi:FHS family L-fucose permease-like MFS transporter
MDSTKKQSSNIVAIITMMFLFAMISFVTNLAAPFGLIWGNQYSWAGMMGNMMNFLAYLFMGIPAGKMLIKYGYKKTALIALAVGFVGIFIQYLSSTFGENTVLFTAGGQSIMLNFIVYLLGAFVCGFCVCMLNTVVNPMLNLLGGGGNHGNQLIQTGGTLNSLTATLTPLFVGVLIGSVTPSTAMTDVTPLLFIAMAVFALSFLIIAFVKIEEPQKDIKSAKLEHSPLAFRHCLLGIIGIFFYVGIEVGIPSQLTFFLANPVDKGGVGLLNGAAIGGAIAAIYWLLMLVGRFSSSIISGKVSTRAQLITTTALAIILLVVAIILPSTNTISMPGYSVANGFGMFNVPTKCLFIVLCGICTSVMWGGIFNLATEGLGKYTASASGLFMTMVVGGGVMPFIQNLIANGAGYITSYWLVIAMLAYLLYYALIGSKNVNKDIPVE